MTTTDKPSMSERKLRTEISTAHSREGRECQKGGEGDTLDSPEYILEICLRILVRNL
jgi:hypothetical protein